MPEQNFIFRPALAVYNTGAVASYANLLNFDTTDPTVDEGTAGSTWTTDNPAAVTTTDAVSKFGGRSLFINSTSVTSGYLDLTGGLTLPNSPWTISFWVNVTTQVRSGYGQYLAQWGTGKDGLGGFAIDLINTNNDWFAVRTQYSYSTGIYTDTLANIGFVFGQWAHIVLQYDGTDIKFGTNGYTSLHQSNNLVANLGQTQQFRLGWSNGSWDKKVPYYVDNFVFAQQALFDLSGSTYTVPTSAL